MNLRTLQYLVALADTQHFGRAAATCYVSQPTLSMQIKKLEQWLGLQLLERTNKSVQLTQVGAEIAKRARAITQDVNQLKTYAQIAQNPLAGDCRMGLIHTVAPYLLSRLVPKLKKALPDCSCYLIEGQTDPLILQLLQGECDVVVAACPIDHPHVASRPLYHESFYLAVPSTHALAKRKSIAATDLPTDELLLLKEGHCLREQALDVCQHAGLALHESFQATSLETLRHMVASGLGVTLIPAMAKAHDKSRQITYIPFKAPAPRRTLGLFWRKTNARVALFEALANTIVHSLAQDEWIQAL